MIVRVREGFDPAQIDCRDAAAGARVPLLFIVREEDTLTPPAHFDRLFGAAPPELRAHVRVPDTGHNDALPRRVAMRAAAFLAEVRDGRWEADAFR